MNTITATQHSLIGKQVQEHPMYVKKGEEPITGILISESTGWYLIQWKSKRGIKINIHVKAILEIK